MGRREQPASNHDDAPEDGEGSSREPRRNASARIDPHCGAPHSEAADRGAKRVEDEVAKTRVASRNEELDGLDGGRENETERNRDRRRESSKCQGDPERHEHDRVEDRVRRAAVPTYEAEEETLASNGVGWEEGRPGDDRDANQRENSPTPHSCNSLHTAVERPPQGGRGRSPFAHG